MKLLRPSENEDLQINLAPLIDVIFILLIFFVLTTSFVRENRIPIVLPEAESTSKDRDDIIEVVIDADGNYIIDDKKLYSNQRGAIRTELQRAQKLSPNSYLQITADARVAHSKVVTVMDLAGQIGFSNLRITTREINPK
ncbi:MAG: biopolymer transporter ExbD [Candidatus Portiera sp.]|nr:biopolymer transporter ExbD [Portiera sp.]